MMPLSSTTAATLLPSGIVLCCIACVGPRQRIPTDDGPRYTMSDTVEMFAPGVISTGDVFASTFLPDGRTVYFTKSTNDRSQMQIMRSRWTGAGWTAPVRASFSTATQQMDPHVAPDGKTLYFTAPRRRAATTAEQDGDWDTWYVKLDGDGTAERVTSLANSPENEMYPSIAYDDALYFGAKARSAPATAPTEVRYWSRKLRTTPVTISMGPEIISASNPYISPDGRVLIVSATGSATRGRSDLFVLVRGRDGRWSTPRNLGTEVNTDDVEFCPQLTRDGAYLFFSRIHYEDQRMIGNNIFVVPVRSVPVLRDALNEQ